MYVIVFFRNERVQFGQIKPFSMVKENSGQQFQAGITTLVGVCLDSPQISSGTGCWHGCISPLSPGPPCSCPRRPCTLPADWPMKAAGCKRTHEKELRDIPHHYYKRIYQIKYDHITTCLVNLNNTTIRSFKKQGVDRLCL